jgi:hypothetical protein
MYKLPAGEFINAYADHGGEYSHYRGMQLSAWRPVKIPPP